MHNLYTDGHVIITYDGAILYRWSCDHNVPFHAVGVTVAGVQGVHAVLLQATGTLLAARRSTTPVGLDPPCTRTPNPPAERRALCTHTNGHIHMQTHTHTHTHTHMHMHTQIKCVKSRGVTILQIHQI